MRIAGCASLVYFREHVPYNLRLVLTDDEDNDDVLIIKVSKKVDAQAKSFAKKNSYDFHDISYNSCISSTSSTLLSLLSQMMSKGTVTKQVLSIAQSIQYNIN